MRDIGNIIKVKSQDELSHKTVEMIIYEGQCAIERDGRYLLALSGGLTPQPVYKLLASEKYTNQLDWTKVFVFFTDERCVSPDHPDSNYNMVKKLLFDYVSVRHVFRMNGEDERLDEAALVYEKVIQDIFSLKNGDLPVFDLILLGMGEDGHVASLFPGSDVLIEEKKLVVAPYVRKFKSHRISLTFNVINHSRKNVFIISGNKKSKIVNHLCESEADNYPISRINFAFTNSTWIIT